MTYDEAVKWMGEAQEFRTMPGGISIASGKVPRKWVTDRLSRAYDIRHIESDDCLLIHSPGYMNRLVYHLRDV